MMDLFEYIRSHSKDKQEFMDLAGVIQSESSTFCILQQTPDQLYQILKEELYTYMGDIKECPWCHLHKAFINNRLTLCLDCNGLAFTKGFINDIRLRTS